MFFWGGSKMSNNMWKKGLVLGVMLLFVGASVIPRITINVSAAEESLPFFDNFENIANGVYPSANGWQNMYSGATAYVSTAQAYSGSKSFCLHAYPNWARTDFVQITPPEKLTYECCVKVMDSTRGAVIGFSVARGSYNPRFNCINFQNDGKMYFTKDFWDGPYTYIGSYTSNVWYKIKVDLDYTTNKATIYINDVQKASGIDIYSRTFTHHQWGSVTLDKFAFALNNFAGGGTSTVYFDDVKIEAEGTSPDTIPPGKISTFYYHFLLPTPTGFVYPTGLGPNNEKTYNYGDGEAKTYYKYYKKCGRNDAGWLARGDKYDYVAGKYHIAQDIKCSEGDPIFAISEGIVRSIDSDVCWNWKCDPTGDNKGILIEHTLSNGNKFLALYGHIHPDSDVNVGDEIYPGQPFATLGPYGDQDHLHFGIRPGTAIPPSPWGALPLANWINEDDPPTDTNGFVDPIEWIKTRTPESEVGPTISMIFYWNAPADDGHDSSSGKASYYDIRYSTTQITEDNWENAIQCSDEPQPADPGTKNYFIVNNLDTSQDYHFGLITYDDVGNPSELSRFQITTPGSKIVLLSPAFLNVTDPDGLSISNDFNEIPGATYEEYDYDGDGETDDVVNIPTTKIGDYLIKVIPEPGADPNDVYSLYYFTNGITIVLAVDTKIGDIPDQPYIVRVTGTEIFQVVPSSIDIDPDTLKLKSKGKWVTCYIEFPEGYNVSDINISTILLNDTVSAESHPTNISDYDDDGIPDLMVKFDRQDVIDILEVGDNVEIIVSGKLFDETRFEGIDYIKVKG